ncbi:uncharacterized protein PG986_005187 [Apiospora aurea]|uniref:Uncharacterized protein n=1 Tax=Apiospora aurea TaxID=335848 RepID=A0ABR1QGV5_9PEZI
MARSADVSGATCYNLNGDSITGWLPCYSQALTQGGKSTCCSKADFCMSNGLCLNGGDNQFFSLQGCTDRHWGGNDCRKLCNPLDGATDASGLAIMWMCDGVDAQGLIRYCCGTTPKCCDGTKLPLERATAVFRPPQAAAASASRSSTSSSSTSMPAPASASSNATDQPAHENNSNSNSQALAIGLGVGIPMGLALLGGIIFLGFQVRKWTAAKRTQGATLSGGGDNAQEMKRYDHPRSFVERQELHANSRGAELR